MNTSRPSGGNTGFARTSFSLLAILPSCALDTFGLSTSTTSSSDTTEVATLSSSDPATTTGASPGVAVLHLTFAPVKQFVFNWTAVAGAEYYQLRESVDVGEPYVQVGDSVPAQKVSITMPLHLRPHATYILRACGGDGCTDSDPVTVASSLAEAIGELAGSNTNASDWFGVSVALSRDGKTLAVGALLEDGMNDNTADSGAVYVFIRDSCGFRSS